MRGRGRIGTASAYRPEAARLSLSTFAYTGPAHYTLDYLGVWRYRHTNVPPMAGARLVYNWIDNSDAPASITLIGNSLGSGSWGLSGNGGEITDIRADGRSGRVLQVVLSSSAGGVANSPYLRGSNQSNVFNSAPPIFFPGRLVHMRYDMKLVTAALGTSKGYFYHRPVDNGSNPTESRPNNFTLPAQGSWVTKHSIMQLNAVMTSLGGSAAVTNSPVDAFTYNLGRMSADFASGTGSEAFQPPEYVPGAANGPGWRYFPTVVGNSRSNGQAHSTAWQVLDSNTHVADNTLAATVVDAVGASISGSDVYKGLQQEPAITNVCTADNYLYGIGYGKMSSGGSLNTTPPLQGSVNYAAPSAPTERLRYEVDSMPRHPYQGFNAKITFVQGSPDTIVHADGASGSFLTDGWKVGDGIWAWMGNEQVDGTDFVGVVAAVTAGLITLSTNLTIPSRPTATGRRVRLYRIPKVGDQVLLLTNSEGGQFRTSITSVTRPTYSAVNTGAWHDATDGIKAAVRVGLTAAPTEDGGWINTDNGIHFFYWTNEADFGVTVGGTGTLDVVYDRENMRAAGLDDIAPHGLCFKLTANTGNVTFDFQAGACVATVNTVTSIFAKRFSGASAPSVGLQSHASPTTFTNSGFSRVSQAVSSAGTGPYACRVTVNGGSGNVVYCIGGQIEQSAVNNTGSCPLSSPLVNPMKGTGRARTAKLARRAWGKLDSAGGKRVYSYFLNDFKKRISFTPRQVLPNVTQAIWGVGDSVNGAAILLGGTNGDSWIVRKTISSAPYDATLTLTPVVGTTYTIDASFSASAGVKIWVNSSAGTPHANTADISALTQSSFEEIGSWNGANACFGDVRDLDI